MDKEATSIFKKSNPERFCSFVVCQKVSACSMEIALQSKLEIPFSTAVAVQSFMKTLTCALSQKCNKTVLQHIFINLNFS